MLIAATCLYMIMNILLLLKLKFINKQDYSKPRNNIIISVIIISYFLLLDFFFDLIYNNIKKDWINFRSFFIFQYFCHLQ